MQHGTQVITNVPGYGMPRVVPIAPAPLKKSLSLELSGSESEKKRYTYGSNPYSGAQAASIARRNARERNRVKQVNDSFNALRRRLPASVVAALSNGSRRGSGKKLSKVDTLRMVVEYIRHLEDIIQESDESIQVTQQPEERLIGETKIWSQLEDVDEGYVCEANSPYTESIPSPVSDCSSGVSVYTPGMEYYSGHYQPLVQEQLSPVEDQLFDTMSWWQPK